MSLNIWTRPASRIALAIIATLGAASLAPAQEPAPPAQSPESIQARALDLADSITARLDAIEALEARVAELDDRRTAQLAELIKAQADVEISEITLREYREGTFPKQIKEIEAEQTLADSELEGAKDRLQWSEQMFKGNLIAESQVIADRLKVQKAEISVAQAGRKSSILKSYSFQKQIAKIQGEIDRARADAEAAERAVSRIESERLDAERDLDAARLDKAERQAIELFTQAFPPPESPAPEDASALLDRAVTAWSEAQAQRAESRFRALMDRIRQAAKSDSAESDAAGPN